MPLFKSKTITREDGQPYLKRWYILNLGFVRIRLHKIMLSDYDCLHDHPWNFITIILKGGYTEKSEKDFFKLPKLWPESNVVKGWYDLERDVCVGEVLKWYGPGSVLYRNAEYKHKIVLPHWNNVDHPSWSLVFMLKRRREWGFWSNLQGFIPWYKYNSKQSCD